MRKHETNCSLLWYYLYVIYYYIQSTKNAAGTSVLTLQTPAESREQFYALPPSLFILQGGNKYTGDWLRISYCLYGNKPIKYDLEKYSSIK